MTEQAEFSFTERAAKRINAIVAKKDGSLGLRLAVNGGGCSGFSYDFGFAEAIEDDDLVYERDGAKVVIDKVSIPYLEGSELDFVEELIGAHFKVNNPQATANCGCGVSFSI